MNLIKNTRGFTLVELSIALVIIGLLIGGILVGQNLVDSAKISRTVTQIQGFDAATASFKLKYKGLPGDSLYFSGDGNGIITLGGNDLNTSMHNGEIGRFWTHILPAAYQRVGGTPPISTGASKNVPACKMGKVGSFFTASATSPTGNYATLTDKRNFYAILSSVQAQTLSAGQHYYSATTASNSAATPAEAAAFDQKADDGVANTGDVKSGSIPNSWGTNEGGIIETPTASTCSAGPAYTLSHTAYECTPIIRMGGQTGELL